MPSRQRASDRGDRRRSLVRRLALGWILAGALQLAAAWAALAAESGTGVTVEVVGLRVLEPDEVLRMAGRPPRSCDARERWAKSAADRIVRTGRARGYDYARVWFELVPPCTVRVEVDEGYMHRVVFVGASAYRTLLMRVDVNLPREVFHRTTLERALAELQAKHGLLNAYYGVRESSPPAATQIAGVDANPRVLTIYVVTPERFGWDLALELDLRWGLVPTAGVTVPGVLLDDDRLHAEASVAVPYRRYAFEETPAFQWVHGEITLGYRFPWFADGHLAPAVVASTQLSQYHRVDVGLESFYLVRTVAAVRAVVAFPPRFGVSLGGGLDHALAFLARRSADPDDALRSAGDLDELRYTVLLEATLSLATEVLRRDQRDDLGLSLRFASSGAGDWMLDTRLSAQLWFHLAAHDLVLRARGVYIAGDVRFWDEEGLGGSYQRVSFGNRYWVREAAQLVVAARFAVWENILKLGVFHDGSVFGDRTGGGLRVGLANAFGPALHWILFDFVALDVYYGFGFDRHGFDHALSFELRTVF
jgi:hypothetical protein